MGAKILIFDRWFRPENEAEQGNQKRQYGKQKIEEQAAKETGCAGEINTDKGSRRDR